MSRATQQMKSVLLFGDQTDSWGDGLDQVYKLAGSTPWLQAFLEELTRTVNKETKAIVLDSALQESLGVFSSLHELGERYRNTTDELGMAHCLLLHTVRASNLLQWARRDAGILNNNGKIEWLGISGGLITMSALAVSEDFDTLRAALLEIARLLVRLCKFTSVKSRSVEDRRGVWGWAIVGVTLEDLSKTLEEFQESVGIPPLKRAKPGVTGAGWSTIIGPPSVLERFIHECPAMKRVAKNPLKIHALQHTIQLTEADVEFIVGDTTSLLNRPIYAQGSNLWGMDEPDATYVNWGDMLRAICTQVLSRGLDITKVIGKMTAALSTAEMVNVIEMGITSHTSYLLGSLEKTVKVVTLEDEKTLLQPEHTQQQPAPPVGRIAIVGVSGRGPMCDNISEFWDIIMSKTDTCTEVPKDRFDIDEFYCTEHGRGEKKCTMTTKYGCFMNNPGHFDSRFFHISPREAMLMDPCHRQFLMSTYEALEMAGYSNGKTKSTDPNRIATFYGQVTDDWHDQSHPTLGCDAYTLPGVQRAFGPGRVAWQFNWEGPTYALDSACASTTSCVHLACMSLQTGDIDMAVAGAGNILNYPHSFASLSKSGVLSDTGNCKTFRDDADGYCRGDFVGSVVLKRLEDAEADNDKILAVIAGSGRNHSGNSPSITTSDAGAQERLFRKVLRNAHVSASDISYVEMHGTGTQVGDPAEMGAVGNLLKHTPRADGPVPVGGVKANFGHGEGAAGMASLMKCIKMFETNIVPPQAGMPHALNPKFPPLADLNVEILSEPKEFKRKGNAPRRILLNNFDAAGGNACMLLEEYMGRSHEAAVEPEAAADPRSNHVVVLSARTPAAHLENKRQLLAWLRANPDTKVEDIAYTTTARRMHHPNRFACTATSTSELVTKLGNEIAGRDSSSTTLSSHVSPVVFVFTGQGSHYAGMGRELYGTSAAFREAIDLCARIGEQHGFPPFVSLIIDAEADMASMTTAQTQLAVLALEVGLVAFWNSVGLQPAMVMGHSLGEYAALYAAGVLSLADVIYLVGRRAALLLERCEADTFVMLSVSMPATEVQAFLDSHTQYSTCSISCINSTTATVISGSADDIGKIQQDLAVRSKALAVPYGFHSFQVDPVLADYKTVAVGVTFLAPRIPVASTLLGAIVDAEGTFDAEYLAQQTRQPVDFVRGLNAVTKRLVDPIWIELGPSRVCTSFIKTTLSPPTQKVMSTLEGSAGATAWTSVSKCMAAAYLLGIPIDWRAFHQPYERHLAMLTLPSYAWDMKDYWITFSEATGGHQEALSAPDSTAAHQQMISTLAQYVVSESSSAGRILMTLRAALADPGLSAIIDGHRMQDLPIMPGSAFCEAAFAAAIYALNTNGRKADASITKLSLRRPSLKRPLTKNLVGSDGELITTVTLKEASNDIQVSWKATSASKGSTYELGSCSLAICPDVEGLQASWDRISHFVKARMDDIIRSATEGRGHRFQPDIFYALFAPTVQYDSQFKSIKEAFVSSDFSEAAAEIVLKDHPAGTRFVASPYWGESVTHLAGFAVNANPQNFTTAAGSCFINSGFTSFEQTVPFEAGKVYLTYVRVSEKDAENKICDVFVFDSDNTNSNKLVAQCWGLSFHMVNNAALRKALGDTPRTSEQVAPSALKTSPQRVTEKEAAPAANIAPEPQEKNQQPSGTSDSYRGVFDIIIQTITAETGVDQAELTDDTALADIGIDSIMSIEIASKVSEASGLELAPSFLIENVVIGDLRRQFAVTPASTPSVDSDDALEESSWDSRPETSLSFREEPELVDAERPSDVSADTAAAEVADAPRKAPQPVEAQPTIEVDDSSPQPSVRITLLQGAGRSKGANSKRLPPFYMIADGTGTIATYIHLPATIKTKVAIYGIDSPYLHCPTRLTPDVGIPGAAKFIVEALLKKQPEDTPFWIGGFSGGAMMAYEVCRQLSSAGRSISGLLLIDMCAPRLSSVPNDNEIGLAMFEAVSGQDDSGIWRGTDNSRLHLQALFASVAAYNPPPLGKGEQPPARRTALIWAEKGMIDRCTHSERFNQLVKDRGIATTAYPGFMEDPKLGAVMWGLPHKTGADLGFNGWHRFVGGEQLMCMSVGADHLQMPTPSHAPLLGERMDRAFDFFQD
ncbi:putative beta-ketoacyl synthase domain-containing protein [Colletotrichum sublineola]|uniref:Putative beta-ketoacyl synthase domain-containing protein n=1 Tax=Colletotrichum sublineola TaxID=1173701 RepID=A0A066XKJ9_COLSU|nr:putative beta-ketoacyl synthase domain-containing protein [Colletotrichum sublineola]